MKLVLLIISSAFFASYATAQIKPDPYTEIYEYKSLCDKQILIIGEPDPSNPRVHIGRQTWNKGYEKNCAEIAKIYPTTPNGIAEAKMAKEISDRIKQEEKRKIEVDKFVSDRMKNIDMSKLIKSIKKE